MKGRKHKGSKIITKPGVKLHTESVAFGFMQMQLLETTEKLFCTLPRFQSKEGTRVIYKGKWPKEKALFL